MLRFDLDETEGIIRVKPEGRLHRSDFAALSETVDGYIGKKGLLSGLLISTSGVPVWDSFATFRAHMAFIGAHHTKVARVALVTDHPLLAVFLGIADFFLQSEVRRFNDETEALRWLSVQG